MRFCCSAAGVTVSLLLTFVSRALAQKTEAGLIAAWEQKQKSDPRTTKFEKIADKKYHFVTTRFPFDGEVDIVDVDVRKPVNGYEELSFSPGTVGVQLAGVSDDFLKVHAASYEDWLNGNTLYWDQKSGSWLKSTQFGDAVRRRATAFSGGSAFLFGYSGLLVVIVVVVLLTLIFSQIRVKRMMKRNERALQMAERNLQLQEQNAKVFKEILEALKQRSS